MSDVNDETIHLGATAPMTGLRLSFMDARWAGHDGRALIARLASLAHEHHMTLSSIHNDGQYIGAIASSDDADDLDYFRFADVIFDDFMDYLPQIDILSEEM